GATIRVAGVKIEFEGLAAHGAPEAPAAIDETAVNGQYAPIVAIPGPHGNRRVGRGKIQVYTYVQIATDHQAPMPAVVVNLPSPNPQRSPLDLRRAHRSDVVRRAP